MSSHASRLAWPLAALPSPLGYAWASVEVSRYDGWGQWAAAPLLLAPLGYGLLVGLLAAGAAVAAARARRPYGAALLGATLALAPWFLVLARNLVR